MWLWLQGYPVRRTVIVNTHSDKAFRGVLWAQTGRHLVLRNAELLHPREAPTPIDGEVVIERNNVDFVQVVDVP